MKTVFIDMDEVLADTLGEHLARYNSEHGASITPDQLHGKWLWQAVPAEHQERVDSYLRTHDFFEDLGVIEDSQRVLREMVKQYEVYIATAAMEFPNSFGPKYRWLQRHFPWLPPSHFIFCGTKAILRGDYLIDDQPLQLRRFAGEGVLFTAPHNLNVSEFRRVDNWKQVANLFLPGFKF